MIVMTLRERLIALVLTDEMKEIIVHLLEQLAQSTKNPVDDFMVAQIKMALGNFGPEDLSGDP